MKQKITYMCYLLSINQPILETHFTKICFSVRYNCQDIQTGQIRHFVNHDTIVDHGLFLGHSWYDNEWLRCITMEGCSGMALGTSFPDSAYQYKYVPLLYTAVLCSWVAHRQPCITA